MSPKFIIMTALRTIIRLYHSGVGLRSISLMSHTSRNTVKKYISIYNKLDIDYQTFESKSDADLYALFCVSEKATEISERQAELEALLPAIVKRLKKAGATSQEEWKNYITDHPEGYGLTQFRYAIKRYRTIQNPSMMMEHKAGDKLFIDYTGDKLHIYPHNQEPQPVEVFVAILGCSQLTYVEASASQKIADFITACENALYYYGGVPRIIVPDNLKSAVIKSSRYEPKVNEEFARFAEHYNISVLPARPGRPKDKSHVENAVKLVYRAIFAQVESLHCPDLRSLNAAIRSALEGYNNKFFSRRQYSRRQCFDEIERDELGELNHMRYSVKKSVMVKVDKYGHVLLGEDKHIYSVPHTLIGRKVRLAYSATDVEVWDNLKMVAHHSRERMEYGRTLKAEHKSPSHRAMEEISPETLLEEARTLHPDVEYYLCRVLNRKRIPEQGVKSCRGILSFARKVGAERLAQACRIASSYDRFSYSEIADILSHPTLMLQETEQIEDLPEHDNIRGSEYYK